ncbi:MAG: hypothetical protein AABZ06_04440 [Bdellovibrionota bacterium]
MEQTGKNADYTKRFSEYFEREVAQHAAKSISDKSEIELQIIANDLVAAESLTFMKEGGKNLIHPRPAVDPHIIFKLTPSAADEILADTSTEIGPIGVNIMKLIISRDPSKKISFQIKAGIFTLITKGYFGVLTAGGGQFMAFLASKGINGIGAIKAALKKK